MQQNKHSFFLNLIALFALYFFSNEIQAQQKDTAKLPFAIAKEKRLPEEDIINKKEGIYFTGLPDFSSDPLNGFGYGGEGTVYFNGKRSDPFFAYTPYRAQLNLILFNTTRKQREFIATLDVPYLFNTKWRLRMEAGYESNPNLLYFGKTAATLNGLSYYPGNDSSLSPVTDASYSDYKKNLDLVNAQYHNYLKREWIFNASLERSFLQGRLRTLFGFEAAQVNISTFNGISRLQQENAVKPLLGLGNNLVTIFQLGLIYDTRDLETDPSKGIFAELNNEYSAPFLGSAFGFNKLFFHFNYYQNLSKNKSKKLVFAFRTAHGHTTNNAPFFEFQDQWSSEGSIEGLGGTNTLRGYKQSRFMSNIMSFNNAELRWRFTQVKFWKQHLEFQAVPFADAGGVWDKLSQMYQFKNYRFSEGLGARIVWNENTVIRLDYAISKEDHQFFLNFDHCF